MSFITLFWHRRDLRIEDNAALYQALKHEKNIQPVFIFDTAILDKLERKDDLRVNFIYHHIIQLQEAYNKAGSDLWVFHGTPMEIFKELVEKHSVKSVYTNRDYEPYAQERDKEIYQFLKGRGITFKGFKDQVIFEKNEIIKKDGNPYTVYTPYSKKWKDTLNEFYLRPYPTDKYLAALNKTSPLPLIPLEAIGFIKNATTFSAPEINEDMLKNYHQTRDIPALKGTSRLSVHLRFGTISIRKLAKKALITNEKYLNELIWREFYQMILFHFPHTIDQAFKPAYDHIVWMNDEEQFARWCEGKTGYPIVDAGMRELNTTGFMHNRVRMIVASFLTKHLLIDWRWGEAYFAQKLLDFELASNVGGWQWAAGSGCDAAPYFRVFNPQLQTEKFDPILTYIKHWIPEIGTSNYPKPIVDHTFARNRVLEAYKNALK